jgi:hypothetical protein
MMSLTILLFGLSLFLGGIFVFNPDWCYKHFGRRYYCRNCAREIKDKQLRQTMKDIDEEARYQARDV